jgi:hypothetical protein
VAGSRLQPAPQARLLKKQIDEASAVICGRGTVEGAPHLKSEHLPVFDCANKCGKTGKRFIPVEGHIRMMAAAQPFITGAISKTINLPNEATVEEIKQSYTLSWELGLKANALYRDGSKLSQPLNVKSDEDLEKTTDEEDADAVEAAREEVAAQVATGVSSDNLDPVHTKVIEKIVERIVERPLRRRLPDTRHAVTHKFDIAGHEGYITAGLYEDGTPGEVFITMAKEGSTIGGLMDAVATLVSVSLQYGVPVESLVRKFEHVRFEPSGMTRNRRSRSPSRWSITSSAGSRWSSSPATAPPTRRSARRRRKRRPRRRLPPKAADASSTDGGSQRAFTGDAKPFDYGSGLEQQVTDAKSPGSGEPRAAEPQVMPNLRLAIVVDPLSHKAPKCKPTPPPATSAAASRCAAAPATSA